MRMVSGRWRRRIFNHVMRQEEKRGKDVGILEDKMLRLGIELDEVKSRQFQVFYEMLVEWNKVMNLTGITEYEEVVEKHFVDSASIVNVENMEQIDKVIDVGTGAGFPGIPLKIIFPHLKMTLLDSLNKRVKFLNEVIHELRLKNIEAVHSRAEDLARREEHREGYDLSVSRAVANLASLSEYCIPYTRVGGRFVSYKSGDIDEEVKSARKAVEILGGRVDEVIKFQLPDSDINRSFVRIVKVKSTGKKYPRKAGLPAKEPLK